VEKADATGLFLVVLHEVRLYVGMTTIPLKPSNGKTINVDIVG
jgi:hypothetical protein